MEGGCIYRGDGSGNHARGKCSVTFGEVAVFGKLRVVDSWVLFFLLCLRQLASIGSGGRHPNHMHRDIMRTMSGLEHPSIQPNVQLDAIYVFPD